MYFRDLLLLDRLVVGALGLKVIVVRHGLRVPEFVLLEERLNFLYLFDGTAVITESHT